MNDYLIFHLFRFVWRHRFAPHERIVKIKGWRTVIIDRRGHRVTAKFLFPFEGPSAWRSKFWRWLPDNFEIF